MNVNDRIRNLRPDRDDDPEGNERTIPAGTSGRLTSLNHTDDDGLKHWNVSWEIAAPTTTPGEEEYAWTVWSEEDSKYVVSSTFGKLLSVIASDAAAAGAAADPASVASAVSMAVLAPTVGACARSS